jgi:hypothetical protein
MTFGQQNSEAEGYAQMDYALDRGINMFDAAEVYPIPPKPATPGLSLRQICKTDIDGSLLKLSSVVLKDIEELHLAYPNPCP